MKKTFTVLALMALTAPAWAAPIENPVAVFSGLDKITGKITSFSVPVGSTARFGALYVTPRTCHTRPVTEEPRTMAFVEVDERLVNAGRENGRKRIFTGWMNAESPGLNAVEHPVFDVWLTGCKGGKDPSAIPPAQDAGGQQ
jgi:hypothetical protein